MVILIWITGTAALGSVALRLFFVVAKVVRLPRHATVVVLGRVVRCCSFSYPVLYHRSCFVVVFVGVLFPMPLLLLLSLLLLLVSCMLAYSEAEMTD